MPLFLNKYTDLRNLICYGKSMSSIFPFHPYSINYFQNSTRFNFSKQMIENFTGLIGNSTGKFFFHSMKMKYDSTVIQKFSLQIFLLLSAVLILSIKSCLDFYIIILSFCRLFKNDLLDYSNQTLDSTVIHSFYFL